MKTIAHRSMLAALGVIEGLGLRTPLRRVFEHLPPSGRMAFNQLQVRLGFMEGLVKVPEADLERSMEAALRVAPGGRLQPGDAYLEFGVYVGTSMACMHRAADRIGANDLMLVGFDSFEGMPVGGDGKDNWLWQPGQLYSDRRLTRANLRRLGVPKGRVRLVKGWFEDSLTESTRRKLGIARVPVAMFDCVLASSTRTALDFCAPLITDTTVIFFDDWSASNLDERGLGERQAFEAWLADHPEMSAQERPDLAYGWDSVAFVVTRTGSTPSRGTQAADTSAADGGTFTTAESGAAPASEGGAPARTEDAPSGAVEGR